MPSRRWSPTTPRSRSSPGTTTSGDTPTDSRSSQAGWLGPWRPPRPRRLMASSATAPARGSTPPARGDMRNYILVTGAYWTDTLVDGAIRTLVLFYFDQLGYTPLQV